MNRSEGRGNEVNWKERRELLQRNVMCRKEEEKVG
jgi:hypothetical protein